MGSQWDIDRYEDIPTCLTPSINPFTINNPWDVVLNEMLSFKASIS